MEQQSCESCRYWRVAPPVEDRLENERGDCCRRSPVLILAQAPTWMKECLGWEAGKNGLADLHAIWPRTAASDWCGEYKPSAAVQAAPTAPTAEQTAMPIDQLGFRPRVIRPLRLLKVFTLGELLNHTELSLMETRGFGIMCLGEVRAKLAAMGLRLKGNRLSAKEMRMFGLSS